MTEAEWLTCVDPHHLFMDRAQSRESTPRLLRLFAVSYWRWRASHLTVPARAVELHERVDLLEEWAEAGAPPEGIEPSLFQCVSFYQRDAWAVAHDTARLAHLSMLGRDTTPMPCAFFRDIFGNPFRPVTFSPEWRTSTAALLSRQMYESGDFSAMPILADALQDAGCYEEQILDHCRGPGPHVRGCWALDLVLGRD